jgi:hypothetical protein
MDDPLFIWPIRDQVSWLDPYEEVFLRDLAV